MTEGTPESPDLNALINPSSTVDEPDTNATEVGPDADNSEKGRHEGEAQDESDANDEAEVKTEDREFVYVNHLDPRRQVGPPSVYLDDVQRIEAEKVRAKLEDREPDLENPPAMQSTPLVAVDHLPETFVPEHRVTLPVVPGETTVEA